jgi:hypothetical protein
MRTVLIGSDFMYDKDGNLRPIEINTAVGWNHNKLESNEDSLDLTNLQNFITNNQFTKLVYIGNITWLNYKLESMVSVSALEYEYFKVDENNITIPYVEDNDQTLIIRSAYDTTALVDDAYCKDKVEFLKLIKEQSFGFQFAYKNENNELVNNITTITDNGIHPNFILKHRNPNYDKSIYPKLFKVSTQEELDVVLTNVTENYFLMEFLYNPTKLYENHIQLIRGLNLLFPPNLESLSLGAYTTFCNDDLDNENTYNELFELTSSKMPYITSDFFIKTPKLQNDDLVVMADGTTKTAEELSIGDYVKTIDIPNPFDVNNYDELVNYGITFEELQNGTTYSSNKITKKQKISNWCYVTKLNFTDNTDWLDTEGSRYLSIKNNQTRFLTLRQTSPEENTLKVGDSIILLNTSDDEAPSFIQKEVASIERLSQFFGGYTIEVERKHLFLTKAAAEDTVSYVAIEHNNVTCYEGYWSGCIYSIFCGKSTPRCCGNTYTCVGSCSTCIQP